MAATDVPRPRKPSVPLCGASQRLFRDLAAPKLGGRIWAKVASRLKNGLRLPPSACKLAVNSPPSNCSLISGASSTPSISLSRATALSMGTGPKFVFSSRRFISALAAPRSGQSRVACDHPLARHSGNSQVKSDPSNITSAVNCGIGPVRCKTPSALILPSPKRPSKPEKPIFVAEAFTCPRAEAESLRAPGARPKNGTTSVVVKLNAPSRRGPSAEGRKRPETWALSSLNSRSARNAETSALCVFSEICTRPSAVSSYWLGKESVWATALAAPSSDSKTVLPDTP